ncbi:putative quinol monooxygenase [Phaeobacter sp. J2-8]|uniref:putative quinol monooxygenase n=1 Tax=Phaeobacter sp. J2-8 TaxID=2931394 RepID=UPI001FD29D43|nr:putative quinol monooxygenase [Phaeobacter sp. J2-8]MCJ7874133.1 antibiotic biosynthesis monooxygenase [Phaeobacter sp. J2-8]
MYAVTVTFTLKPGQGEQFLPLMSDNAATSLRVEEGCHQFDVCTDPARPDEVFLYELYTDAAAFQAHLAADHFKAFDAATADMVADKRVALYAEVRS